MRQTMRCVKVVTIIALTCSSGLALAAGIPAEKVTRPEGTTPYQEDTAKLVSFGEQLWKDPKLSKKGKTACASCHKDSTKMFKKSFAEEYPHQVAMAKSRAKLDSIDAEQMVQFCMLVPMKSDTLPWESKELAALTAYTIDVAQKQYIEAKSKK